MPAFFCFIVCSLLQKWCFNTALPLRAYNKIVQINISPERWDSLPASGAYVFPNANGKVAIYLARLTERFFSSTPMTDLLSHSKFYLSPAPWPCVKPSEYSLAYYSKSSSCKAPSRGDTFERKDLARRCCSKLAKHSLDKVSTLLSMCIGGCPRHRKVRWQTRQSFRVCASLEFSRVTADSCPEVIERVFGAFSRVLFL